MGVKIEQIDKNVVKLEIEVDKEKFEEGMNKSFAKNAKRFKVAGFRPGKAPRKMVERIYGEEVLYDDALNFILPEAYDKAIEENDIHPVDQPEFDIVQIGSGQNLIFTATVTVKPEVELGEYKNIKVKKIEAKVEDEDVERELNRIARQNSRLVAITDRPVKEGDVAYIDFEGFVNGEPFEGGKGSNYALEIGSGTFVPGFEEQLVGAEIGQEVEVKVTFPEDYHSKELAGKEAVFKCKINEIKEREMPVLDDEFAKDVSEFDTLDEYKQSLREKLLKAAEENARSQMENELLTKVTENAKVDIPEVMIEKQINYHVEEFERRLAYQGLTMDNYLEMTSSSLDEVRAQFRDLSAKEIKTQLVIEKISKVEGITASDDEFDERVKKYADSYKRTPEEFKKLLRQEDIEYIKDQIVYDKTIEFLVQNADYTE